MSRQSSWSPLGLLLAGLVVIIMLVAGPDTSTRAVQSFKETYPPPQVTQTAAALQTATALQGTAYPGPGTATATVTSGVSTTTPQAHGTPTTTLSASSTSTAIVFPTQTAPAVETTVPLQEQSTPTFTETPVSELVCAPGVPLEVSGEGPPRAAFLLYFGQRVVSGGSVDPNGRFTISLVVGSERAGTYTVSVKLRGTSQVLREFTCGVPPVTPTPLPTRVIP